MYSKFVLAIRFCLAEMAKLVGKLPMADCYIKLCIYTMCVSSGIVNVQVDICMYIHTYIMVFSLWISHDNIGINPHHFMPCHLSTVHVCVIFNVYRLYIQSLLLNMKCPYINFHLLSYSSYEQVLSLRINCILFTGIWWL